MFGWAWAGSVVGGRLCVDVEQLIYFGLNDAYGGAEVLAPVLVVGERGVHVHADAYHNVWRLVGSEYAVTVRGDLGVFVKRYHQQLLGTAHTVLGCGYA